MLLDLFTVKFMLAYGTRPAHLFGDLGPGARAPAASAILGYLAYVKFFQDEAIGGRPLLLVGLLLLLIGFMLVQRGPAGRAAGAHYHESQGKPIYVVKEVRPDAAERRADRAAAPVRLPRVLFLTESFHPVLGRRRAPHPRRWRGRLAASRLRDAPS